MAGDSAWRLLLLIPNGMWRHFPNRLVCIAAFCSERPAFCCSFLDPRRKNQSQPHMYWITFDISIVFIFVVFHVISCFIRLRYEIKMREYCPDLEMHSWMEIILLPYYLPVYRGYPAKRTLSAMRKHGGQGPFGRIPSIYSIRFWFNRQSMLQCLLNKFGCLRNVITFWVATRTFYITGKICGRVIGYIMTKTRRVALL